MSPRPSSIVDLIEFTATSRERVVQVMDELARDRDGWLNFQPDVEPDDLDAGGPSLIRVFSARGPAVPLGSWVPGARRRNGEVDPVSLGLQHPGGRRAVWQLRDEGHAVPASWKVLVDHPRRGLVVNVPDTEDHDLTLSWLISAAALLSPTPLPQGWHAGVYRSR